MIEYNSVAASYQSEGDLERELINDPQNQGYKYRPDLNSQKNRIHVNEQQKVFDQYWRPIQKALGELLTEFVRHELLSQHPAGIPLPSLGEDRLEGIVFLRFVEQGRPGLASIQGVIHPTRFVRAFWSSQLGTLSELNSPEKRPDTFSFIVVPPVATSVIPRIASTMWVFAWPGLYPENDNPLPLFPSSLVARRGRARGINTPPGSSVSPRR